MKRQTTLQKERKVIRKFHRQLRSGIDFSTDAMYEDAGRVCYLSRKQAGNIVRNYYNQIISEEMQNFVNSLNVHHEEKISIFSQQFGFCTRESRLIINYIIRK